MPGRIHVTAAVDARLRDRYHVQPRGVIEVNSFGQMRTYLLTGRRAPAALKPLSAKCATAGPRGHATSTRRVAFPATRPWGR